MAAAPSGAGAEPDGRDGAVVVPDPDRAEIARGAGGLFGCGSEQGLADLPEGDDRGGRGLSVPRVFRRGVGFS